MRVLRQLDEQGADYKALVEKELKARLGAPREEKPEEPEKPAAAAKPARCASCGTTNDHDAVFCKKCGKTVAA
jgi:membrane protease subunit (stomatin/prohibitin family)